MDICKLESCSKEFVKNDNRQKFCSHSCAATYNNIGRIHTEDTKKKISKKLLKENPLRVCMREGCENVLLGKYQKMFCSLKCAAIYKNSKIIIKHTYICEFCNREFIKNYAIKKGRRIHCEICKRHTHNIENPISLLQLSKRTVTKILKRLNIGCSLCGYDRCIGDVHHIISKRNGGSYLHDNLTYICTRCHREAHNGLITEFITLTEQIKDEWLKVYYTKNNGCVV